MAKVVLVGAGSTSFAPAVLANMVHAPEMAGSTLALVDIDPDILQTMVRLAERVVRETGADLTVEGATDRRDVLPGADFVVVSIAVGGSEAWKLDLEIPAKYGIAQTVGDSVGPGGLSRALRHVPVLVGIARDMQELCPRAYLFNYTNPMTALTRAVRKVTTVEMVGLCVGPLLTRTDLAEFLGLPPAEVQYHGAGVNHCFWLLDVRYRGQDVYQIARDRLAGGRRADLALRALDTLAIDHPELREFAQKPAPEQLPFCYELLGLLDYLPGPGDRHVTEFFPELFPGGPGAAERYGLGMMPIDRTIARKSGLRDSLRQQATGEAPLDPKLLKGQIGHSEEVVEIMSSVVKDKGTQLYGNIPNRGLIANLPYDAVVEVPLTFGGYGYRAYAVGDFPKSLMPWITRRLATVELTVEAALTGDRKVALQALLADGWVNSLTTAQSLLDELLEAHASYLPQFR